MTAIREYRIKKGISQAQLDRLDGKVTALEGKPGKRWDNLVEKLIWAVVAAVAGFFLAQIGLG